MVTRFGLGGHLSGLAAAGGGGGLWAAVDAAGAGHRGGTLSTAYGQLATIDPAGATAEDLPPPQLLGLINDGLVTLNHVAGAAGTRLVPDLALALPEPTDRGRTYTFRLRPDIRYSTGALVRPSDVTHSFERLFQLGGAGAPYYQAISGTAACREIPASCDLSSSLTWPSGFPLLPRTRSTSCPSGCATTSSIRSGERSSISSGSAKSRCRGCECGRCSKIHTSARTCLPHGVSQRQLAVASALAHAPPGPAVQPAAGSHREPETPVAWE